MSEAPPRARRRALQPRLATRLVLVLSIAILPLGLISVLQTNKVLSERQALSEAALQAETQRVVSESREVIQSAVSAADTIAVLLSVPRAGEETCEAAMRRMVARSGDMVFAGFHHPERGLICASEGLPDDLDAVLAQLPKPPGVQPRIHTYPLEFLGAAATVSVMRPVYEGDEFLGTVWVAVPASALNDELTRTAPGVDLVLFQEGGGILATERFDDERRAVLPRGVSLAELAERGSDTFRGLNRVGQRRDFAVVPIIEGRVYALGSWSPQPRGLVLPAVEEAIALYFPLAMWAIAIGVAYVGVHRLVIRHVRRLRSWMRRYASGDTNLDDARLDNAPEELEVMAESFRAMTRRLSEHDRRLEEDLEEKTVLLREVHHRVKNNLQLISSMMNMQIRASHSPEAKHLLRRVQDRVAALSAIHRYLYMARKLSALRADKLLDDIIRQLVIVGELDQAGNRTRVSTALDPVEINPDQSVPLSLLATEAAMNAVKYSGAADEGDAWINIALQQVDAETLCLSVVNSRAPAAPGEVAEEPDGSGLGSRLIQSFVTQLNGTMEVTETEDRYELHVVFPLKWHEQEDKETG